jgi:hypothetical protein
VDIEKNSTGKEMIPITNAINAHAQNFVATEELLLPIRKVFGPRLVHHMLLEIPDVFSLYLVVVAITEMYPRIAWELVADPLASTEHIW